MTSRLPTRRVPVRGLSVLLLVLCVGGAPGAADQVHIQVADDGPRVEPFWAATGFFAPQQLLQPPQQLACQMRGALPGHGVVWLRIHHLFNLIEITGWDGDVPVCDFARFDVATDQVHGNGQRFIFELMGNPGRTWQGFLQAPAAERWRQLVRVVAEHLIERYGRDTIRSWRFETYNEPDWGAFFVKDFKLRGSDAVKHLIAYADACQAGLADADPELTFGGPGTMRDLRKEFQAFVAHADGGTNHLTGKPFSLDFITVHLMDHPTRQVARAAKIRRWLKQKHPALLALPLGNDEAQWTHGWGHRMWYKSTPLYASFLARQLDLHQRLVLAGEGLFVVSADGGYQGDWLQRTQYAYYWEQGRSAVIPKPFAQMYGLLGRLDGCWLTVAPRPEGDRRRPSWGVVASRHDSGTVAILAYRHLPERCRSADDYRALLAEHGAMAAPIRATVTGLPAGSYLQSVQRIGLGHGDPFAHLVTLFGGDSAIGELGDEAVDPDTVDPIDEWQQAVKQKLPSSDQLASLRAAARLELVGEPVPLAHAGGELVLELPLSRPGVTLLMLHPATANGDLAIPRAWRYDYAGLHGDEALLRWDAPTAPDLVGYELATGNSDTPLDLDPGLDGHLVVTPAVADRGLRVRARDAQGRTGPWRTIAGTPPFTTVPARR